MTPHWSDESLDAALGELLNIRARQIEAAALPAHEVSARLADQQSWRGHWRDTIMNNTLKVAMAGTGAVVVAVLAIGLYFSQPGGVGPSGPPTPYPGVTPDPTTPEPVEAGPEPSPLPAQGTLEPGTYLAGSFPLRVALTVPQGYEAFGGWAVLKHADDPLGILAVGVWEPGDVSRVYADPCNWSAGQLVDPGPTADDFVAAISEQPGRNPSAPVDVTLAGWEGIPEAGFHGKRIQLSVPADQAYELPGAGGNVIFPDCDGNEFRSWPGRFHQGPGQIDDLWILDVDGFRVVISASYWPDTPANEVAELVRIIESIEAIEIVGR
jgi:hypothetical protein